MDSVGAEVQANSRRLTHPGSKLKGVLSRQAQLDCQTNMVRAARGLKALPSSWRHADPLDVELRPWYYESSLVLRKLLGTTKMVLRKLLGTTKAPWYYENGTPKAPWYYESSV